MIDFNNINKEKLLKILITVVTLVSLFVVCYCVPKTIYNKGYNKGLEDGKKSITVSSPIKDPTLDTIIDVDYKDNNNEPDLIINNKYKATINGTTIDIPVKDKKIKETLENPPSSSGATNVTAKVDQELDLSPLFKDFEKKKSWEAGIGVGVLDNKWYVPVEVQRNFGYNKAIGVQLNVSDKTIEGAQITYKIRF